MADHPVIWLEPACDECEVLERTWCQDNVYEPCEKCGRQPVKYVIASDQPAALSGEGKP